MYKSDLNGGGMWDSLEDLRERERRATHHRRAVTDVVPLCVFKTNWIFLFGFIIPSYEEKRRELVSQSVSHRLEQLFTYPPVGRFLHLSPSRDCCMSNCLSFSLSLVKPAQQHHWCFVFPLFSSYHLSLATATTVSGVSRIFVTFLPPSLSCVCVCMCVHLFLIRSDPSRLAVMDYIAPVEKERESWEKLH